MFFSFCVKCFLLVFHFFDNFFILRGMFFTNSPLFSQFFCFAWSFSFQFSTFFILFLFFIEDSTSISFIFHFMWDKSSQSSTFFHIFSFYVGCSTLTAHLFHNFFILRGVHCYSVPPFFIFFRFAWDVLFYSNFPPFLCFSSQLTITTDLKS